MAKTKLLSDDEILRKALPEDPDIEREYDRLLDLFRDSEPAALALHRKTIARAAFLSIVCDRLEKDISEHGYESKYQNGQHQFGTKPSTAANLLPQYEKLYLSTMKELRAALKGRSEEEPDEFDRF